MDIQVSTESLLFNELFLRSILLIPLTIMIYILLTVYKQYQNKFKNHDLIKPTPPAPENHTSKDNPASS